MYLAVDIGATKTLVAIFHENGVLGKSLKFPTPANYSQFLIDFKETVDKLTTPNLSAVCVAVPGKVDRKRGLGLAFGNLGWENVPIKEDVHKITGLPVAIENDANLAGLAEAVVLKKYKRVLYITISTGIGGVIVQDGKIEAATQDAEVGHMILEHGDRLMRWQEFASGKAIVKRFGRKASEISPSDHKTWYEIAHNLAIGLIDLIATLTPEVIVLGGGVGSHFEKFKDPLLEALKIYENPLTPIPPILAAKHPEEAVVYGCYELLRSHNEKSA